VPAAQLGVCHRALAETFEGQIVQRAVLGEQQRRLDAVAREAGAAAVA
jgi:hypothetical protein